MFWFQKLYYICMIWFTLCWYMKCTSLQRQWGLQVVDLKHFFWRDGTVCKMFAMKARGLCLTISTHVKNARYDNVYLESQDQKGEARRTTANLANKWTLDSMTDHCLKTKVKNYKGRCLTLTPPHLLHTHTSTEGVFLHQ